MSTGAFWPSFDPGCVAPRRVGGYPGGGGRRGWTTPECRRELTAWSLPSTYERQPAAIRDERARRRDRPDLPRVACRKAAHCDARHPVRAEALGFRLSFVLRRLR